MAGSPLSAPRELRFRWYLQVEKYKKSIPEICAIFGISRKTYYKWYRRDHGLSRGIYKPRDPHPGTKLTPQLQAVVTNIKQRYNYGPKKMVLYLKEHEAINISSTAIYKFYRKKQLIQKSQTRQAWYTPMKEPFYASIPGENVQLDVKYVPGKNGTWAYQYRFIDTVTNLQYAEEAKTRDAHQTIMVFKNAKRLLPFPITGIQTDNGGEFRGVFHDYLLHQVVIHRYIPKRSAPWNGKVERANRSIDDEYYLNTRRPWQNLAEYTNWYNTERYHLGKSMNGLTPWQKFLSLASVQVSPLKVN